MAEYENDYVESVFGRSSNMCNRVPCCEACPYLNGYIFEMYGRVECIKQGEK